jgi:hypothetical protein
MSKKPGRKILHVCEVCGKKELLTPEEGFEKNWDYPPKMGQFGIVSPRTCGDCAITDTVWWAVVVEKKSSADLTDKQKKTIQRILQEPHNLYVKESEFN